jgi:hypothetical protein
MKQLSLTPQSTQHYLETLRASGIVMGPSKSPAPAPQPVPTYLRAPEPQ